MLDIKKEMKSKYILGVCIKERVFFSRFFREDFIFAWLKIFKMFICVFKVCKVMWLFIR